MDKLNFHKQMILCFIMIFIGLTLGHISGKGFFYNYSLFFSGLLFVIHPVYPPFRELQPTAKSEVRVAGVVLIIISLFFRF